MYKSAVCYRKVNKYPLNSIYMLNSFSCQKNVCKQGTGSYTIRNLHISEANIKCRLGQENNTYSSIYKP